MDQAQLLAQSEEYFSMMHEQERRRTVSLNSEGKDMKIHHIIPAAGNASRWQSKVMKELLPIPGGKTALHQNLLSGWKGGAQTATIITNPHKINSHVQNVLVHPIYLELDIYYTIQQREGLWGAITSDLSFDADYYFFSMPDTVFDDDIFTRMDLTCDLTFGIFDTYESDRYGIIDLDSTTPIRDKATVGTDGADAWGVFGFSREVRDFWRQWEPYSDYTEALNHATLTYGYETVRMDVYHDFADYQEYFQFVRSHGA